MAGGRNNIGHAFLTTIVVVVVYGTLVSLRGGEISLNNPVLLLRIPVLFYHLFHIPVLLRLRTQGDGKTGRAHGTPVRSGRNVRHGPARDKEPFERAYRYSSELEKETDEKRTAGKCGMR